MFACHVCRNTFARDEYVCEVFTFGERRLLVDHIPAQVCMRCGEAAISSETAEQVRRLVHGEGRPSGSVTLDVFALP